jgi:cytidylate kinase
MAMAYRAIALSQVDGAGADSIGRDLAERLGFGYLNEGIVAQVAHDQGVNPAAVADAERRRSFFARVAEMTALGAAAGLSGVAPVPATDPLEETDSMLGLIREAVRDAASRGDVVLVAHAACYACADTPGVLRVCVTAPMHTRTARTAAERGIGERDAQKLLRRSDAGRSSYLKRAYGIDEESPSDYDVVVNAERFGHDGAVALLAWLARGGAGGGAGDGAAGTSGAPG